jgi:hypothetical protein
MVDDLIAPVNVCAFEYVTYRHLISGFSFGAYVQFGCLRIVFFHNCGDLFLWLEHRFKSSLPFNAICLSLIELISNGNDFPAR